MLTINDHMYIVSVWAPYDEGNAPILGARLMDINGNILRQYGTINYIEGVIKDYLCEYLAVAASTFGAMTELVDRNGPLPKYSS
jgi:hypothetical protein